MADFTIRPTAGTVVVDWQDPATPSKASRLNATAGFEHRNYQAKVGYGVEIKATVGGVEGEIDGNLGGRLFTHWFAEFPSGLPSAISSAPGFSSIASFIPALVGNYLLVFYREEGGSISIPIEVVVPIAP